MSNGVAFDPYNDKEKKNNEKSEKGPKSAKNENFGKRKTKTFLPIAINNIYSKN